MRRGPASGMHNSLLRFDLSLFGVIISAALPIRFGRNGEFRWSEKGRAEEVSSAQRGTFHSWIFPFEKGDQLETYEGTATEN